MTRIESIQVVLSALLLATLTTLTPLSASAQTRDGATPSREGVCDELLGGTPGLYGLCVAFCEAQDCDRLDLAVSGQCRAPSPKLLERYDGKRGPDDPSMPCLTPETEACPCFSREDLSAIQVDACFDVDFGDVDVLYISDADEIDGALVERGLDGWGACGVFDDGGSTSEIGPGEVQACELLIRERADELGMDCPRFVPH